MFFSLFYYYYFSCDLNNFPKILNSMRVATLWCSGHPKRTSCRCVCARMCVRTLSHVQLLRLHGWEPPRLLCPWTFPGKNTGGGCHFLFHRVFPAQGSELGLPSSGIRAARLASPALAGGFFTAVAPGKPPHTHSTKNVPVMIDAGMRHRLKKSILKMKYFQFKLSLCETSKL